MLTALFYHWLTGELSNLHGDRSSNPLSALDGGYGARWLASSHANDGCTLVDVVALCIGVHEQFDLLYRIGSDRTKYLRVRSMFVHTGASEVVVQ